VSVYIDSDGFYHPTRNAEIAALVRRAREDGLKLRVHGDGHSVAHAIYTDPLGAVENKVRPPRRQAEKNIDIVLDRYGRKGVPGYRVWSRQERVIEVDGGMRLGRTRGMQEPNGLLQRLDDEHDWSLRSTGGIAHQTVAGFIATASAGGSLQSSVSELVCGVQLIDGTGAVVDIDEHHPDFRAVVPHLGLLGIVTKVRLRCCPSFTVKGKQVTSSPKDAAVNLFGPDRPAGPGERMSLAQFLSVNDYARIEWWPQRGTERLRVWTGMREGPPPADFHPREFKLFEQEGDQLRAGIALTALGNLRNAKRMRAQFQELRDHSEGLASYGFRNIHGQVVREFAPDLREMGLLGRWVAAQVEDSAVPGTSFALVSDSPAARLERDPFRWLPKPVVRFLIEWWLPRFFGKLLDEFAKNGTVRFHDRAWRALPMDDDVDDVYLPVEFSEIWVPLKRSADAMRLLHWHFGLPLSRRGSLARTGTFEIELYATTASKFWLHPAYSDGNDVWSDGALRINPYWYGRNAGDPARTFFPRLWKLLRDSDVPFRLHWGKFLPPAEQDPRWAAENRARYPGWKEFMAVRKRHDPDDIFLNDYWRAHLGLARIADLHCHYPMRVLADRAPEAVAERTTLAGRALRLDGTRCLAMKVAARALDFRTIWAGWRVTFGGLKAGSAGLVVSVLYDPVYELLVAPGTQYPRPTAFRALLRQLRCVEADLLRADPDRRSHSVVKTRAELEDTLAAGRMAFVHCVEGGLCLGDNVRAVKTNIARLAEVGVAYITIAHLFYRGFASNASGLPGISDGCYDLIFRQRERGLSTLGRAVVEAMYEHNMIIDLTHMDPAALWDTFELLNELDERAGADPTEHPVIASHAGFRFGALNYMLDRDTIEEIKRRGGVIGLILATHQLEDGFRKKEIKQSRFYALDRHIAAIFDITGTHAHTCIGSDHDGFIKPTVSGIDSSERLRDIEEWLRGNEDYAHAADAILYRNAERVVSGALP
jgi:D-arabinono-1,4-lactone oxidase